MEATQLPIFVKRTYNKQRNEQSTIHTMSITDVKQSPVELPELLRMIMSHIPLEERACMRRVNRNWNANAVYTTSELVELLHMVIRANSPAALDWLLRDPRVDPSSRSNCAIHCASLRGHLAIVELLLKDPRVDPSDCNNRAIRLASRNGHLAVVDRLLQDPRVNPSTVFESSIRLASLNGHLAVVERLLQDPRVDPSEFNNRAVLLARRNGHVAVVERLLKDPRVNYT